MADHELLVLHSQILVADVSLDLFKFYRLILSLTVSLLIRPTRFGR